MLTLISSEATEDQIKKASEELDGYIKYVVDLDKEIMTIGGLRHVDGEQLLLKMGSKQQNLWGGGIDWETKEIDFDSMINIRPNQGNTSREVLNSDIRQQMQEIVKKLLL